MWHLILTLTMIPAGLSATWEPPPHPIDGPDVDLRVQIQERAVRFQIIMNLAYVDEIVDTPREDEYAIQPNEHQAIRQTLFEFYRKSNRVTIDGVQVAPLDQGFEVDEGDPTMLPLFPRSGEKALVRVRLALDYPCKGAPTRVSMTWGEFPVNQVLAVPGSSPKIEIKAHLIAKGIDKIVPLTATEPEYTWHDTGETVEDRFLAVPEMAPLKVWRISVMLAGLGGSIGLCILGLLGSAVTRNGRQRLRRRAIRLAVVGLIALPIGYYARDAVVINVPDPFDDTPVLPSEEQAKSIFVPLHRNIYRAFDYVDESDIYDALARSVRGDLLDALYTQVYRSLIMHEEGGAVSRVEAVKPLSTDVESIGLLPTLDNRPGFQVRARWQVMGVVRHWNHAHYRTNEYEAQYTVVQADHGWRIADHQVLGQKRVDEGNDEPRGK